jgi:aminopeptidase N
MVIRRLLALGTFCFMMVTGLRTSGESAFSYDSTPGQLPKSVYPLQYNIRLEPDLEKFTTRGTETVEFLVLKPVTEIVLNALDLDVTKATLITDKEIELRPRVDAEKQTLVLPLPERIGPGKYKLSLEFSGKIGDKAQGLFYVRYSARSGKKSAAEKKIMLGTQMEPTDARRMFPCWDEPVFRAGYQLTVVVPEKHLAVSNMPIEHEKKLGGGWKEVQFQRTPPMASYLVVLVSGELEELKGEAEGVPIRIITTEGKREQAKYALEVAERVLAYYNDYFAIRYPMPKLDLIAIPGGFSGAMENWGAITYNERNLLFDPATSSQGTRQGVFSVVAHEMAHQWFGDLVTMSWWDNLWLNEGFASWMSAKASDLLNPDWQESLTADATKSGVMNADARRTTHPIQQPVANESQANDAFDSITYQKGQSFLRMLENFLGENTFRKGIRQYLADHEFSNTTTADLWNALAAASGKPVKAMAAGWTEQPGFPVVMVKTQCVGGRQIVTLEQERFTVQYPDAPPLQWTIPVALMDTAHPNATGFAVLNGKKTSVPFGNCNSVIKANAGDAGYYVTAYEPELFAKLRQGIAGLPAADRMNLLDDTWLMVQGGRASSSDYLDLAQSLKGETTGQVANQIISVLDGIDGLEQGQPGRAAFRKFACGWLQPQLDRLGWEPRVGEPPTDRVLRSHVITSLGNFGDAAVIREAQARFAAFLKDPRTLPADLRGPVLMIAGRYGDRETYEKLHDLARGAKGTEERQLYYRAMAGALDPELAMLTLSISLTDETVPQETAYFPAQVAGLGEHQVQAWDFARRHMPELLGQVESFRRNTYVPGIMGSFSDAARADELEAYVKANVGESAMTKARETAEGIRLKAALRERELPVIDKWVADQTAK